MAYPATVYSIMIATPSDVTEERAAVREIITDWNVIHSKVKQMVLLPVGWDTHSIPELAGRPQGLINERVLDPCDLLVGVFWTRIGTSTGLHESGTVEEIKRHVDAKKPALIYFSTKAVNPDALDQEQYNGVKDFKKWCQKNGIHEVFGDTGEFKNKLSRQLQIKANDLQPYLGEATDSLGARSKKDTLQSVFEELDEIAVRILIAASEDSEGQILNLEYVNGATIETNGINFVQGASAKERAEVKSSLKQLEDYALIEAASYKRQVFTVTNLGYQIAELCKGK